MRRFALRRQAGLCPVSVAVEQPLQPLHPRDVDEFKTYCELTKVALAVWVAKSVEFPAFDRWKFSFESGDRWHARSLDAARAKAVELVGQAKFDATLADPWIGRYLQTSIRIYGETTQNGNSGIDCRKTAR